MHSWWLSDSFLITFVYITQRSPWIRHFIINKEMYVRAGFMSESKQYVLKAVLEHFKTWYSYSAEFYSEINEDTIEANIR